MIDGSQLPPFIRVMLDPAFYPDPPVTVQLLQTQMSFVFIAGDFVYKVKKPVNLGYLDYTTLEQRQHFCRREVELNRRLCPDAYLGVLPITNQRGTINLAGTGDTIEYTVKMRRLPQDRMMDTLLVRDQVSTAMLSKLSHKLVDFHQSAETSVAISAFGSLDAIRHNVEENFDQTEKSIGRTITTERYQHIKSYARSFMANNAILFQQRLAEGRIRDCHGDLHAAHVCFTDGICIYDCIEFNDRFRYGDTASEVAFLTMDMDHYGRPDLSGNFVDSYVERSHDQELKALLPFYKCYRAYVRGKVESFKLDDPYITTEEKHKASAVASSYFGLAESYI